MIIHPNFDPVAISLGPLKVHWYGLMYLLGFGAGLYLGLRRADQPGSGWRRQQVWDLLFFVAVGVIIGGRLGSALFYNFGYYLENPVELLYIWNGGMSFHGGLVGVLVAVWLFGRQQNKSFLEIGDFLAPLCPLGLGAGRIGNFINQELWGKTTDVSWGVVFQTGGPLARHPSQLYEALLEGLVMFLIIWIYSRVPRALGRVSGLFLLLYGMFRFFVEFFREPDGHIGYIAFDWVTMGQLLSVPLILIGALLLFFPRPNVAAPVKIS